MKIIAVTFALAVALCLGGVAAQAAPITVPNPSFESPDVDPSGTAIDNWTQFTEGGSGNGIFDESRADTPAAPDGDQWAYFYVPAGIWRSIIWIQTGGTVADNTQYTVDYSLGDRDNFNLPDKFKVSLWADDPSSGGVEVASETINPTTLGLGNLGTANIQSTLTTGTTGSVGDPLYLRFMTRDTSGNKFLFLDDVVVLVPEPGTAGLLLLGAIPLVVSRIRRASTFLTQI